MTNAQTQEVLATEGVTLDQTLGFHLTARMFPPVHADFYPAIKSAITEVASENYDEPIELPNGRTLSAGEVVDQLRAYDFVDAIRGGGEWA